MCTVHIHNIPTPTGFCFSFAYFVSRFLRRVYILATSSFLPVDVEKNNIMCINYTHILHYVCYVSHFLRDFKLKLNKNRTMIYTR